MELRVDRLLQTLRERGPAILEAIDTDPLLTKREAHGLVLANASKALFTPLAEHHLFAKGIIYQRQPYRLVSLPLLKIFNLGEREVTVHDLAALLQPDTQLRFLRKFDGTMIQRFQHDGRVFFTTRGMLEGAYLPPGDAQDEDSPPSQAMFDYLDAAKTLAREQYPTLAQPHPELEGLTLVLELLHPEARVITDYHGRRDLVLLAVFDGPRHVYWPFAAVHDLATRLGFTATDVLQPMGTTLAEQIDHFLASLAGSDEEGTVLVVESPHEVIYRVKVKSPDYLRLLRLMVRCTYTATAEMLESLPTFPAWSDFQALLQAQGSDNVPEELLNVYREHYDTHVQYRASGQTLIAWSEARIAALKALLPQGDPREVRKALAALVQHEPHPGLLFAAYDGRLTWEKIRLYVPRQTDVDEALARTQAKESEKC